MHGNTLRGTRETLHLAWGGRARSARGTRTGYARDGRVQGVGPLHSTAEACEQRSPPGTGGAGGGKGAGQGERGGANQEPDTVPGSPVTGAWPRTAGLLGCLHVRPEAGARCGSAARRDLCGGRWVTDVPTATILTSLAVNTSHTVCCQKAHKVLTSQHEILRLEPGEA